MKFSPYLKPEEFATARKRKLVGNTDASQPSLVSTAPGGSMSGNLFPTLSRRCENQIDGY